MSKPHPNFTPLVAPKTTRPKASFFGPAGVSTLLRDQLTITSWLCLGAVLQGALFLLVGRLALLPAFLVLLYRALDAYAMTVGFKRNKYMDGVVMSKVSAQFPDAAGQFGNQPADKDLVVFFLGARSNHPLGALGPGGKEIGDLFTQMTKDLEEHAEAFGMFGMTSWLNASERKAGSETLLIAYFHTVEGLHRFAHSPYHRNAWDWWNKKAVKAYPHISINHETYHVPRGNWESIRINSHLGGINSSTFKAVDEVTGEVKWVNPTVDASKGLLKTSAGRMSRSKGDEHDQYGEDPY